MKKSQLGETSPSEMRVPACTLPFCRVKNRSLFLVFTITMQSLTTWGSLSSRRPTSGWAYCSWQRFTWSPVQLFSSTTISAGGLPLRSSQAVMARVVSSSMALNLPSLEKGRCAEQREVKVELRVAQRARRVPEGPLAVSKESSMVLGRVQLSLGTQRVLPRLAMICRRTLVAMDCRFFFLRVPSVIIWVTVSLSPSANTFSFLYSCLRLLGSTTRQMLAPFSTALPSCTCISFAPRLPSTSYTSLSIFTPSFSLVAVKVRSRSRRSVFLATTMPHFTLCLLLKMGLSNSWKHASLPIGTAQGVSRCLPSSSCGVGITLAPILDSSRPMSIPNCPSSRTSLLSFSRRISPSISWIFSGGFLMVASEIFLRRCSSKLSGMPVMRQSSGTRRVGGCWGWGRLGSTCRRGWLLLLISIWQRVWQQSLRVTFLSPRRTSSSLVKTRSTTRQQLVLPQLVITILPVSSSRSCSRTSSFSIELCRRQYSSMNCSTVWLRTIFLAGSTRRKYPAYSSTKLDLQPLNIMRLSMLVRCWLLKYLPVLPISTQPSRPITCLSALLRNSSSSLGLPPISNTFTCFTFKLQPSTYVLIYFSFPSSVEKMFIPLTTGLPNSPHNLLMCFFSSGMAFFMRSSRSCRLSCATAGVNLILKTTIFSMGLRVTPQWLVSTSVLRKESACLPFGREGSITSARGAVC